MTVVVLLLFIAVEAFLLPAGVLLLMQRLFKIKNPTYGRSLLIVTVTFLASILPGLLFVVPGLVVGYVVFHHLHKRYFSTTKKTSLGLYASYLAASSVIIVIANIILRTTVAMPYFFDGVSMEPTFHTGDYLLAKRPGELKRGEVVVYQPPAEPDARYVHRIVGLPGETLELRDGQVYVINASNPTGVVLQEPYIIAGSQTLPVSETTRWQLSSDEYLLFGDNRLPGKAADSRAQGGVKRSDIVGVVWYRVYPLGDSGKVATP